MKPGSFLLCSEPPHKIQAQVHRPAASHLGWAAVGARALATEAAEFMMLLYFDIYLAFHVFYGFPGYEHAVVR